MAYSYEDVVPSLIPNTTMQKRINSSGVHTTYVIQAVGGYVLHDNRIDGLDEDDNVIPRFKLGATTVPATYDFDNVVPGTFAYTDENGMVVSVPVDMIGIYAFYTLPIDVVPENQTCDIDNGAVTE